MKLFKSPVFLLLLLFTFTRLYNLTLLPVFSDEALYMFWGWQVWEIPGRWWHPLTDAKQPFLMWLFGLGQNIFPDPLFGARLVSVLTGLISLLGLWRIGNDFINRKTAILLSIFYLLSPIFIFFDRQALMESAVAASAVWSLYFLLKLLDSQRLKYALFLGLSLGLGFFTKNSALIFLITTLVVLNVKILANKRLFYSLSLSQISILFVFCVINLPLFFQDLYWRTLPSNSRWIFTIPELFKFPIKQWAENLLGNTQIALLFLTPLVFVFALLGIRISLKTNDQRLKTIIMWFLISIIQYLISLRFMSFMSMRYLAPFLPPLLIFASMYLSKHLKLFVISLSLSLSLTFLLIFSPIKFFQLDRQFNRYSYSDGYITGFDTGFQVNEIVKYFTPLAQNQNIIVTTAVHTFNPESGVWNYLRKDPNITMAFLDKRLLGDLAGLECIVSPKPAYFIAKLNDTTELESYLDKVTVITNPHNSDYSTIYKTRENCTATASAILQLSIN